MKQDGSRVSRHPGALFGEGEVEGVGNPDGKGPGSVWEVSSMNGEKCEKLHRAIFP